MKIKIEHDIPERRIAGLLCCALEGGSNYWYMIDKYLDGNVGIEDLTAWRKEHDLDDFHRSQWLPLTPSGGLVILDKEDNRKRYVLSRAHLALGLQTMAEKYMQHFANFLSERDDAETGDVFLQCCLFGEVVYG